MLILTRKRSETIQIGDDVVIKVIRTGRGSVKLGIDAPQNVRVLRGELNADSEEPAMNKSERVLEFQGCSSPAAMAAGSAKMTKPYIA